MEETEGKVRTEKDREYVCETDTLSINLNNFSI